MKTGYVSMAMGAVKVDGHALKYAVDTLRADEHGWRKVVLVAVRRTGAALRHAGAAMQADAAVVLAAVGQAGLALTFASPELRGDRTVSAPPACRVQQLFAGHQSDRDCHSVGFVLVTAADFSVKPALAPRPCRQALAKTVWRGSNRVVSRAH